MFDWASALEEKCWTNNAKPITTTKVVKIEVSKGVPVEGLIRTAGSWAELMSDKSASAVSGGADNNRPGSEADCAESSRVLSTCSMLCISAKIPLAVLSELRGVKDDCALIDQGVSS